MKLWLLKPVEIQYRGWDEAHGFVVREETEDAARLAASRQHGDEGADAWLDPAQTTCERLTPTGEPGVVLRDFAAA